MALALRNFVGKKKTGQECYGRKEVWLTRLAEETEELQGFLNG